MNSLVWGEQQQQQARLLIKAALQEDLAERGDVTSQALIPENTEGSVGIVARQSGALSGLPVIPLVLEQFDEPMVLQTLAADGDLLEPGKCVATLSGPVRALLTAERTILNFLTHLSGIASLAGAFVRLVEGTKAVILDTRKTHPGYRYLEKYAVSCGGAVNHRMGLYDGMLIKDNHLAAAGLDHQRIAEAVQRARNFAPDLAVEVEVDTLDQLQRLLPSEPEIVLLDNMNCEQLTQAMELRDQLSPETLLEASGGVTMQTVRAIADTGVDRISIGALTHSAPAFDLGFDWQNNAE